MDDPPRSFGFLHFVTNFAFSNRSKNSAALHLVDCGFCAFILFPLKSIFDSRLYTFFDTAYLNGRDSASVAQQLGDDGSDIIQLHAKNSLLECAMRNASTASHPLALYQVYGFCLDERSSCWAGCYSG